MSLTRWRYTVPLRLRSLLRRGQVERELDEELRYHLERQTQEHIARGLTPDEARRAALRAMGGLEQRKEECRDMRRVNLMADLMQDLRYGLRMLRRSPGFTAVAVLSLALGTGANTAIFELLNAVSLRRLPVPNPQEIAAVRIAGTHGGMGISNGPNAEITNPLWEQIREHQQAFSGVFAWGGSSFRVGQGTETRRARGIWVSGDFFPVLGVLPVRGRLLGPEDDRRGCGPGAMVISYGFWQSQFGGQDSAIGRKLMVHEQLFEVVGVTPADFSGLEVGQHFDLALPICAQALWGNILERRDVWWLSVMGRLKPGWTLGRASEHLGAISPGLFEATVFTGYEPSTLEKYRRFRLAAYPAANGVGWLREAYQTSLWLLLGMTGLVLLIACANLANLTLARAIAREREIAVRLALGASLPRLVRQLLSESLLLAAIGATLGIGVAWVLSRSLVRFLSTEGDPLRLDLGIDWRVLAFTASVAVLTCLVFGLVPALRSTGIEPAEVMKAGGRGLTAGRERFSFQRLLVVAQIAVSLALLVGALLFVRSFWNLSTLDPGFRTKGIMVTFADLTRLRLPTERWAPFKQELLERIRAIPQVEEVATTSNVPLNGSSWTMGVRVAGAGDERRGTSKFTWVSPGYFRTMGIPLLAGRDLDESDTRASRPVAVVNQKFVRQFLGGADAIGQTVRTSAEPNYPETVYEIVGVVQDTKYANLREEIPPTSFAPALQHPNPGPWEAMLIRSSAPMAELRAAVTQAIVGLSPEIETGFQVFESQIQGMLLRERLMAYLSGFFGVLAVLLATIGLSGTISYSVVKRRHEIGIRMALGATRADVLGMVFKQSSLLALTGIAIGLPVTLAATRLISTLLFGVTATDPLTVILATSLIVAVSALAGFIPAQRASRVDPIVALRCE